MWMGASTVSMPPVREPRWLWPTLVCFVMRCTPSTRTRSRSVRTSRTRPCLPRSLREPEMTTTRSPFLIFAMSEHLRRQRDDLHELLVAQLAAHRAEDARATGLPVVLEDHGGVLVELDVRTVGTARGLDRADDDGLDHIALLDVSARDRVLDGRDDRVTEACVAALRAA